MRVISKLLRPAVFALTAGVATIVSQQGFCRPVPAVPNVQSLTVGIPIQLEPKDPFDLYYLEEWEVFAAVYDTLVRTNTAGQIVPALATSWEFHPTSHELRFKLRPGLKFSDGSPLTPAHVEQTLKRLLILDQRAAPSLSLTRCLSTGVRIQSPTEQHPSISASGDSVTLNIKSNCKDTLLNDLTNANYGVLHPASWSKDNRDAKDFKISKDTTAPVSGAFRIDFGGGAPVLLKNANNWRWANTTAPLTTVELKKFSPEQTGPHALSGTFDILRISRPSELMKLRDLGFSIDFSLPVMTWFLAQDTSNGAGAASGPSLAVSTDLVERVLRDLNANLERAALPSLQGNSLERASEVFFPKSFRCETSGLIDRFKLSQKGRSEIRIELVPHPSGEAVQLEKDIRAALVNLGYKVDTKSDGKVPLVRLALRRQFLGDTVPGVLNMAFNVAKTISDPDARIKNLIRQIETTDGEAKKRAQQTLCQRFHHYNHVPIAHRNSAFLSKDKKLAPVFSKLTGNLMLETLPEVVARP